MSPMTTRFMLSAFPEERLPQRLLLVRHPRNATATATALQQQLPLQQLLPTATANSKRDTNSPVTALFSDRFPTPACDGHCLCAAA